jgi:soluble lytic murein transglycosylase-like protein
MAEGLDPNFVAAVIKAESNFNPQAVSGRGALGLMQLMPYTAKKYNLQNAFNTTENLSAGIKVLKKLLGYYNGNQELALAAYNAGHNAVKKYAGVPPYPETKNYIKKVMTNYQGYQKTKKNSPPPLKVYRVVDKNGGILFTNLPPRN